MIYLAIVENSQRGSLKLINSYLYKKKERYLAALLFFLGLLLNLLCFFAKPRIGNQLDYLLRQ